MFDSSAYPIAEHMRSLSPPIQRKRSRSRSEVRSPCEQDVLSKRDVLFVLAKYYQSHNFVLDRYYYNERPSSNPFSSGERHLNLEVVLSRSPEGDGEKIQKFLVKKVSTDSCASYEGPFRHAAFKKEVEIYSKMFVDYEKMETEPVRRQWWPTQYLPKPDRVLVLEDLIESGCYQCGKMDHLDREHVFAVLRSLAAFHSSSLKLQYHVNSGEYKSVAQTGDIKDHITVGDLYPNLKSEAGSIMLGCHQDVFLHAGIKTQLDLVDRLPGYSRAEILTIQDQLPRLIQCMICNIRPSHTSLNVFVHGNLCNSNIFFRRNGSDLQAYFVDFEMCRYAPPALDLMMFIHMCLSRESRIGDFQMLLQAYYNMLSVELAKNKISIQDHLPLRNFLDSCNEYSQYGMIGSVFYFQTYFLPSECIIKYRSDVERNKSPYADLTKMVCDSFSTNSEYRTRMTEALIELINTCIKL